MACCLSSQINFLVPDQDWPTPHNPKPRVTDLTISIFVPWRTNRPQAVYIPGGAMGPKQVDMLPIIKDQNTLDRPRPAHIPKPHTLMH